MFMKVCLICTNLKFSYGGKISAIVFAISIFYIFLVLVEKSSQAIVILTFNVINKGLHFDLSFR